MAATDSPPAWQLDCRQIQELTTAAQLYGPWPLHTPCRAGDRLSALDPACAGACDRSERSLVRSVWAGEGCVQDAPPPVRPSRRRRSLTRSFGGVRLRLPRTCAAGLQERLRVEVLSLRTRVMPSGHGCDLFIGQHPRHALDGTRERCAKERTNALAELFAIGRACELLGEIVRRQLRLCHFTPPFGAFDCVVELSHVRALIASIRSFAFVIIRVRSITFARALTRSHANTLTRHDGRGGPPVYPRWGITRKIDTKSPQLPDRSYFGHPTGTTFNAL